MPISLRGEDRHGEISPGRPDILGLGPLTFLLATRSPEDILIIQGPRDIGSDSLDPAVLVRSDFLGIIAS